MLRKHIERLVNQRYEKKTGFNGYVYEFSVDYDATDVDDVKDTHRYLIIKTVLSGFTKANSLSFISMNNEECKARPQVVNVNGDEPVIFPFSTETSKCSGSCNNINYPYVKICVPNVVKNLNFNVFNLMSRTNETRL